ncbi:MAG TPA: hypothetical protein PLW61_05270 [Caldisericia bacterium]|nr:hypothetical protein [Caldisericia bacterium]
MRCPICGKKLKTTKTFLGERVIFVCENCGKEVLVEKKIDAKILLQENK